MSSRSDPLLPDPARLTRLALVWLVLAAWPWIAPNDYLVSLGGSFFINLLLISGLNLLVGYAGQISLAQGGFFGLGAYTSGILSAQYGASPWLGLLAAVLCSALVALLVGLPTLRLRGHYLAMATVGLNAILSVLFVGLVGLTGGPNGLAGVPSFSLGAWDLGNPSAFYFLAWALGGLAMLALRNLLRSRAGRGVRALAASDIAAACMGVPVLRYKLAVFALSAALAGVAGSLHVHQNNYASPETFSFFTSVLLLVMAAVGGFGRYWGGFLGALLFTALPEVMRSMHDAELLVFGVAMIVVVGFLPGGLAGLRWPGRRAS
ncbi:branched-chain amino acid ABC transporter permease [Bordetella hinzii]|uniref:branched-chain amino acid ABC transporter permease n=1 Tax=Bordetella hinzii TaxID=103855 RepID=UPI000400FE7C|nr:branched-chain amino acid ABC transporter permease [Bordetella hinzii]AKQ55656.1 leucine/isoleucine/valine transporter permease subunit [Bordetella hinzii]KCB33897.1 branched-chain amino acid ABC transporter, permease protein [Bordetella hinzii L60]KCB34466.1 branched-chain amino acid ABC transporter, permease protein [Bordetella hinzii CA90 BAL1384]KCB42926.1 branched-chain amino acid ABC transporter, permease protein [Bordetella hinzii 4161]KCB51076.1 branched-chain amino acid ABC transpo